MAAGVAKLAVGEAWNDLATVATEELDSVISVLFRFGFHFGLVN